ncbi:hypothetical protein [Aestuariimicrobium ganziense]|uniref:hypothetical protein n=1 Tax=Aestuariimicrobium ganziense TaxID=2773677 RepID=UPI0019445914|nr:hypothetical protein [Aestuariimicrobium ganziense]
MRGLAETVAGWLLRISEMSAGQWVLRVAIVLSGALLLQLPTWWATFFFGPVLAGIGALMVLVSLLAPDSLAPVGLVAVVGAWWLMAGADNPLWQAAVLALLLGVFHLSCAWAASAPTHGVIRRRLARAMAGRAVAFLLVVAVGLALVLGAASLPALPGGLLWIGLGGLAVVGLAAVIIRPDRNT